MAGTVSSSIVRFSTRMGVRARRGVSACAVVALVCGGALGLERAAGPTVVDVAPESAMMVVTIPDWSSVKASFDRSSLGALWKRAEMRSFMEAWMDEGPDSIFSMLEEMGIEKDDLVYPTGHVGMALFFEESLESVEAKLVGLEEGVQLHMVVMADFGERADDFQTLIDRVFDHASDKMNAEIRQTPYGDATIISMIPPQEPEAPEAEDDDEDEFDWDYEEPASIIAPFDSDTGAPAMHVVRMDGTFMLGSSIDALQGAIDRAADPARPSVGEADLFRRSAAQHPGDAQGMVYVRSGDAIRLMAKRMTASTRQWDESTPDLEPIFGIVGLLSPLTTSMAFRFDTAESSLESTIGVIAPEKAGIWTMVSRGASLGKLPAFVGADSTSVASAVVDFKKIPELAQRVVGVLPDEAREQASMVLTQAMPTVQSVVDALGSEICVVQHVTSPYGIDSQKIVMGVRLADAVILQNLLTAFGGNIGLEAAEFQGAQLFVMGEAGMAVGVTPEWLYVGSRPEVEDSVRRASNPGQDSLNEEDAYKAAAKLLRDDSVLVQYQKSEPAIRYAHWMALNADKLAEAQWDALGFDEELKAQIRESQAQMRPEWMDKLPPADVFVEHIGDSVFELRSTPDGYRGRVMLLKPSR